METETRNNPEWWNKWVRKNYWKKARVLRKNNGGKSRLQKLVDSWIS
jgi:hypothetical protein